MSYRVNYGQGQVSNSFETYKGVCREYDSLRSDQYFTSFYIESDVEGEWFPLEPRAKRRPESAGPRA